MTALNNRIAQMTDAQLEETAWSYEGAYQCTFMVEEEYRSWYEDVLAIAAELRSRGLHVPFEVLGWDDCDDDIAIEDLIPDEDSSECDEAYTEADAWCDARERDEEVDFASLMYDRDQKAYIADCKRKCEELISGEDIEIDEMTRWAIENDCCTASAGGWQFDLGQKSVRSGENVGEMVRLGGPILLRDARIVVQMAFEKASALLMWGELDWDENGAEHPLGVARNVKEAMKLLTEKDRRVDGWEML